MIKYAVVCNIGEHSGYVTKVELDDIWTGENPEGWTEQQLSGPHGHVAGYYASKDEACAILDEFLVCDAVQTGRYCYSHNPGGK